MSNCSHCMTPNPPGTRYCEGCGVELQASSISPNTAPRPSAPVAQPAHGSVCQHCGHVNAPGAGFCENCGLQLQVPQSTVIPIGPQPPSGDIVRGYIVMEDVNISITIPMPKNPADGVIIGRRDDDTNTEPDVDLTAFDAQARGVSRRHARLVAVNGQPFLEALRTTNKTRVNGQVVPPGQRVPLMHGAELRLGTLGMTFFVR